MEINAKKKKLIDEPQFLDFFLDMFSKKKLFSQVFHHRLNTTLRHTPQVGKHPQSFPPCHFVNRRVELRTVT